MSVKISELPILSSLADNDVIAGVDTSANVTSKIEMVTLKNYIDTNTQYTAGTNIDITNNVVSAPNVYNKDEMDNQIEELKSEVDSLSTIFNAFPTESGEGESVTLDDTAEVKFKKFDLKGNTSQSGTPTPTSPIPINVVSGDNEINVMSENLFDLSNPQALSSANITATYDTTKGEIYLNGTSSGTAYIAFNIKTIANGTTISFGGYNSVANGSVKLQPALGGNAKGNACTLSSVNAKLENQTLPSDIDRMYIIVNSGVTLNNYTIKPMINFGTTLLSFQPYQGNTYNINLPVENLWGGKSFTTSQYQVDFVINENGSVTASGTASSNSVSGTISNYTSNNMYKTLEAGTYVVSKTSNKIQLQVYTTSSTSLKTLTTSETSGTFTLASTTDIIVRIMVPSGTTVNETFYFMLEKGSKANSYTPYGTIPIELCKIGNYQDYFYKNNGSWFLHKEIGKVVLNGTQTVEKVANGKFRATQSIDFGQYGYGTSNQMYSNYFTNNANYATYTTGEGYAWNYYIYFGLETSVTTTTEAQTWLTNNTPTFYGILATPTNTEITYQPLIDQLNLLEKAMSKDGQTNISQVNNDKPFILDVTAIKSLQNVLDRIELLES